MGDLYGPPQVILGLVGTAVVLAVIAGVMSLGRRRSDEYDEYDESDESDEEGDDTVPFLQDPGHRNLVRTDDEMDADDDRQGSGPGA